MSELINLNANTHIVQLFLLTCKHDAAVYSEKLKKIPVIQEFYLT